MARFPALRSTLLRACLLAWSCALGCAPRYDAIARFTIDGHEAPDGCPTTSDVVDLRVSSDDAPPAPPILEVVSARCVDGEAPIRAGARSTIFADLRRGNIVVGEAKPVAFTPRLAGPYAATTDDDTVVLDIHVLVGSLRATLTFGGRSCGDAGVSVAQARLERDIGSVVTETVDTGSAVPCVDGSAVYQRDDLRVGSTYRLVVTATTADGALSTTDTGAPFTAATAHTVVAVDAARRASVP